MVAQSSDVAHVTLCYKSCSQDRCRLSVLVLECPPDRTPVLGHVEEGLVGTSIFGRRAVDQGARQQVGRQDVRFGYAP